MATSITINKTYSVDAISLNFNKPDQRVEFIVGAMDVTDPEAPKPVGRRVRREFSFEQFKSVDIDGVTGANVLTWLNQAVSSQVASVADEIEENFG